MTMETCTSGMTKCSMGLIPASFNVLPNKFVFTEFKPAGTIMDNKNTNFIPPMMTFGMCLSLMNPDVMQATMNAGGILTPMPCKPMFTMPWMPGSPTVLIKNEPALGMTSQLMCIYMGVISFITPGEFTVQVPA